MTVLLHILHLRARSGLRGLRDHAFSLLVLGPIVVGGAAWSLERWVEAGRAAVAELLAGAPLAVGRVLGLAVTLAFAEPARRELHPRGEPWLAVLPLRERIRWTQALVALVVRGLVPALGIAVLALLLAGSAAAGFAVVLPAWAAIVPAIGWGLVLSAVRIRGRAGLGPTAGAAAVLLASAPLRGPVVDLLWAPWHPTAAALGSILARGAGVGADPTLFSGPAAAGAWAAAVLVPLLLAAFLHLRWGREDLERAGARLQGPVAGVGARGDAAAAVTPSGPRWLRRRSGGASSSPVPTLIRRDLRLVVRGASARVPATAGAAAALLLPLLDPAVRQVPAAAGVLAAVSAFVLCSLVPGLVVREERAAWNDRVLGFDTRDRLRAKLGVGAVLALAPAAAVAAAVAVAAGPAAAALILLAALAGGTTMTAAAFELPDDPGLAVLWGALLGGAITLVLLLVPAAWWMWTALWLFALSQLVERGVVRLSRPRELR